MTVRAAIRPGYLWRLIGVCLMCAGFGIYSLYDGLHAYPQINRIHDQFEAFKAAHPQDWQQKWLAFAQERNLPVEPAERKSELSILTQYLMAGITLPIALLAGFAVLRSRNRWMEMDEKSLRSSDGSQLALDYITQLDKTRWYNKGIAELQHQAGGAGASGRWMLDAWKYDTQAMQQMVRTIQSRLKPEQVIGDRPAATNAAPTTPPPQNSSSEPSAISNP